MREFLKAFFCCFLCTSPLLGIECHRFLVIGFSRSLSLSPSLLLFGIDAVDGAFFFPPSYPPPPSEEPQGNRLPPPSARPIASLHPQSYGFHSEEGRKEGGREQKRERRQLPIERCTRKEPLLGEAGLPRKKSTVDEQKVNFLLCTV